MTTSMVGMSTSTLTFQTTGIKSMATVVLELTNPAEHTSHLLMEVSHMLHGLHTSLLILESQRIDLKWAHHLP